MITDQVFKAFANVLSQRLRAGAFTTEDGVRYAFADALLQEKFCAREDIVPEHRHPVFERKALDLLIAQCPGRAAVACEFKYDRAIPSGRNMPRPQHAGAIFKDLFRLARIPAELAGERLFIYLTDSEMASYLANPGNGLTRFYDLPVGVTMPLDQAFVQRHSATFIKATAGLALPCRVTGAFQAELAGSHSLRIWRVEQA